VGFTSQERLGAGAFEALGDRNQIAGAVIHHGDDGQIVPLVEATPCRRGSWETACRSALARALMAASA